MCPSLTKTSEYGADRLAFRLLEWRSELADLEICSSVNFIDLCFLYRNKYAAASGVLGYTDIRSLFGPSGFNSFR